MNTGFVVPAVIAFITGWALVKKVDVFSVFTEGAKEGLRCAASVLPALCFLMTAVGMIRESGALDLLTGFASPFFEKLGFPAEVFPLAVIRPFSGSGALGYYEELCETTFYTLAVYFCAVGIKKSRNTVPAALSADIAAAILSVFAVNLFMR